MSSFAAGRWTWTSRPPRNSAAPASNRDPLPDEIPSACHSCAVGRGDDSLAAETTLEQARKQRHEAPHRPRLLVFHSDGVAMNPAHAYHKPTPSVIPHLPGTQTDGCTYSLVHQFPVVRLHRSKVGQEWPVGITEKLFGKQVPDGLDEYIAFSVKLGVNQVTFRRGDGDAQDTMLKDLQLPITYRKRS